MRMSDKPLTPWIISHKDGKVLAAHCDCMADLGESCSHVASLLWAVEAGKFGCSRKNLDFSRTGLAKDCPKCAGGRINTPRSLRAESRRTLGAESATRFWSGKQRAVFKFICWKIKSKSIRFRVKIAETHIAHWYLKFICWQIASKPTDLELKLWKLALLIHVFNRRIRSHLDLSEMNQT